MKNMHADFWVERGKEAYQVLKTQHAFSTSSHVGLTIWHVEAICNGCSKKEELQFTLSH